MKKVKINFTNEQYLELLKIALANFTEMSSGLTSVLDKRSQEYNNSIIRISISVSLHNELQRYTFRNNAKYPSNKSFVPHKAIVLQEALQFYQIQTNAYIDSVQRILLSEINQQLI